MLLEQPIGALVGFAEDAGDLLVDHLGGVLGVVAELGHLAAEERMFLGGAEEDGPDAVAHAALGDHQPGQPGRLLEVLGGADAQLAVDQPLGRPAAHDRIELRQDLALGCS